MGKLHIQAMAVLLIPDAEKDNLKYVPKIIKDYVYPHFTKVETLGLHLCMVQCTGEGLHSLHGVFGYVLKDMSQEHHRCVIWRFAEIDITKALEEFLKFGADRAKKEMIELNPASIWKRLDTYASVGGYQSHLYLREGDEEDDDFYSRLAHAQKSYKGDVFQILGSMLDSGKYFFSTNFKAAFGGKMTADDMVFIFDVHERRLQGGEDTVRRLMSFLWGASPPVVTADFKIFRVDKLDTNYNWLVWGKSGTGKTEFALSHFKNPLWVCDLEDLMNLTVAHDGIVFDDVSFLKGTAQEAITVTDRARPRTIRLWYRNCQIPAGVPKIFTSNVQMTTFVTPDACADEHLEAIRRRVRFFKVEENLYD
mmetsp:Transcript_8954/g.22203  ORF Transcript_8954/g.22203 Transcript_8954/m.22203 type:complete len:365 (-) Transcript_8954:24-1118(-)